MRRNTILSVIIVVIILSFAPGLAFSAGGTNSNISSLSDKEFRDVFKYLQKILNERLKIETGGDDPYLSIKTSNVKTTNIEKNYKLEIWYTMSKEHSITASL